MKSFQEFAKLETAYEIMAYVINFKNIQLKDEPNTDKYNELKKELNLLQMERIEMYNGNEEVIDKVINEYSKLVKQDVESFKV
jgi:hypothetical protein